MRPDEPPAVAAATIDGRTVLVAYRSTADGRTVLFIDDDWDPSASGPPAESTLEDAPAPVPATALLTPREREVLGLIAQGMTARQAAEALGISPKTVEAHKSRIFRKLGVPNQAAAIGLAGST